jgi:hypothetical protein
MRPRATLHGFASSASALIVALALVACGEGRSPGSIESAQVAASASTPAAEPALEPGPAPARVAAATEPAGASAARSADAPSAAGGSTDARAPADVQEPATALERARARWERLTDVERRTLAARYEEFQRMTPGEQQDLAERARRMRETSLRVQAELPGPVRERLRALEPDKRREAVREIVGDQARSKGQAIRAKVPDAWLERLEQARPEQRPAILAQFRDKHLKRIADFAIERAGASLALPAAEIQRLKQLPLEERTQAVLDLRKRAIEKDASENGLPPGMTAEDWTELVQLSPQEFFARAQEYRRKRVDDEQRQGATPAANDPDALPPGRREGLQRLMAAVQQKPEDVIALVDLPKEERRQKLFELRRQRCLEIVRAYHLVPAQRMQELETLGEKRFHEVLRHVLQPLRRAQARADGWPLAPERRPAPGAEPATPGGR